jgi:hypothetical protein
MLYKIWIYYYIFVRKVYKKRGEKMSPGNSALAVACLLNIFTFFAILWEFLFNYKSLKNLLDKNLPLGPIAFLLSFVILSPISIILNTIKIKNKIAIQRAALLEMKQINRLYPIIFLVICGILFIIDLLIVGSIG